MYQEYIHINFHDKHYFINLLGDKTWDTNEQSGVINLNIRVGHNSPNLDWKKKKTNMAIMHICEVRVALAPLTIVS
jgi:hypothetical protein